MLSTGWIVGIVAGVVIFIILMAVPWDKIGRKRDRLNLDDDEHDNVKESSSKSNPDTSQAQGDDYRYFGIFNFFGAKTAIRYEKLVYSKPLPDSCPLCIPFENKVLSLEDQSADYITMSEAVSRGYHHLGCSHIDEDYLELETQLVEPTFTSQDQNANFKIRLKQYRWEDKIRALNFKINNATSEDQKQTFLTEKKDLITKYQIFLKQHQLQRNLQRETALDNDITKWGGNTEKG